MVGQYLLACSTSTKEEDWKHVKLSKRTVYACIDVCVCENLRIGKHACHLTELQYNDSL